MHAIFRLEYETSMETIVREVADHSGMNCNLLFVYVENYLKLEFLRDFVVFQLHVTCMTSPRAQFRFIFL